MTAGKVGAGAAREGNYTTTHPHKAEVGGEAGVWCSDGGVWCVCKGVAWVVL